MGNLLSINSPLWRITNTALHLAWLSMLWLLCCIPIITAGAATTAVCTVTLKYVRNEEGYITSSFFKAFQKNCRQAIVIELILAAIGIVLGLDLIIYSRSGQTGPLPLLLMTIFLSLLIAFVLVHIYVYPLLAKFSNSTRRTLLNAFIMALRHWPSSISMLMLNLALLAIGFYVFPPVLFCAPALIPYINSYFLVKIFDKYTVQL